MAESDMGKQAEARRQALSADYFVSSVSAVTEDGNLVICRRKSFSNLYSACLERISLLSLELTKLLLT